MKTCQECSEQFYGRSDKRYCSDACRSSYHNRKNGESSKMMRRIHSCLKRNWRILKELEEKGEQEVMRESLLNLGFNFCYITDIQLAKTGVTYRFCYDLGYSPQNEQSVLLVNKRHSKALRQNISFI